MTTDPSILIVGAGPAGLVLALSLLQNGVPVRIIAQENQFRPGQRGAGVMPRTLELHNTLRTLPDVLDKAGPVPPIRRYKLPGGTEVLKDFEMVKPVNSTPDRPHNDGLMLGQSTHEALLRAHLAKYNCHVELRTGLRSLEQKKDYVVAHIAVTAEDGTVVETSQKYKWLIGADGGRSTTRKQLPGVSFLGETRVVRESLVVGDIHILKGLDKDHWHSFGDTTTALLMLRPTEDDDHYNLLCAGNNVEHSKVASSRDTFVEFFVQLTGRTDVEFGDLIWISHFTPNIRMVNKFLDGRVMLAGDAAHTHSPTGGQGMNTSVQDSLNLGWKLALVEKGLASPALLSSYNIERLPVVAEMLKLSTALLDKTFAPDTSSNSDTWRRGGDIYQFGVNYRHSPIILDERTSAEEKAAHQSAYSVGFSKPVRAGDRAPDAPGLVGHLSGNPTSVFEIIGSSFHTIFAFTLDAAFVKELAVAVEKLPKNIVKLVAVSPAGTPSLNMTDSSSLVTVEDRDGHAFKGYSIESHKSSVVVVRPDGVIGAIVFGVEGVQAYFRLIFI